VCTGVSSCGGVGKGPRRDADNSSPSSTKVKNKWSYNLLPVYAFMPWTRTTLPFYCSTSMYCKRSESLMFLFSEDTVLCQSDSLHHPPVFQDEERGRSDPLAVFAPLGLSVKSHMTFSKDALLSASSYVLQRVVKPTR